MRSLPGEIWEHVNGSEENVEISNMGRVRKNGKICAQKINKDGYYEASFGRPIYRKLVHRMVALQFVPNDDPEHKTVVDHIGQDNKLDNRASNLRWVTPGENTRAAAEAGLLSVKGKKGFIVLKEIATGAVRIFDNIVKAAFAIKGDEKQLGHVIKGTRKNYGGYSAYRIEETLDNEYYTIKTQIKNKYTKEQYRQMIADWVNNLEK